MEENTNKNKSLEKIRNLLKDTSIKKLTFILIVLILAILIFKIGVAVGYYKARFSFGASARYFEAFDRKGDMRMPPGHNPRYFDSHGVAGEIIDISPSEITVMGKDNTERAISIGSTTLLRKNRDTIKTADLKYGDRVIIIGRPNDEGIIDSHLIRVLPSEINQDNSTTSQNKK